MLAPAPLAAGVPAGMPTPAPAQMDAVPAPTPGKAGVPAPSAPSVPAAGVPIAPAPAPPVPVTALAVQSVAPVPEWGRACSQTVISGDSQPATSGGDSGNSGHLSGGISGSNRATNSSKCVDSICSSGSSPSIGGDLLRVVEDG